MTEAVNPSSKWDPDAYAQSGGFVPVLGEPVLDLLNVTPGERILDLGCGDGVLSQRIIESGAEVVGIDSSPELVARARERGVAARLGDGQRLMFDSEFDAVFSNAALHWMLRPDDVANGVFRALRPGGRFVGEMGGFGNIAAVLTAIRAALCDFGYDLPDPGQFYPTIDQYEAVCNAAGFTRFEGHLIPRSTLLPGSLGDWIRTFRQGFFDQHGIPADVQDQVINRSEEYLRPSLCDVHGNWFADYVRLRFVAYKR